MRNQVDFHQDIPSSSKVKNIIFYPDGLKIYGLLPYLLSRKLSSRFSSSFIQCAENNFTLVSYNQKPEHVQALVDWLYSEARFEGAIASAGERLSDTPDHRPMTQKPPQTFQTIIAKVFGAAVETKDVNDPKPWDVVLGGLQPLAEPQLTDAILGGKNKST